MSLTKLEPDIRNLLVNNAFQQVYEKEGERGLNYLLNRGITKETIDEWKLGYCPKFVRDIIFNDRAIIFELDQLRQEINELKNQIMNHRNGNQ